MTAHRQALAAFLKARRAAVPPESAGLAAGRRRRTPGLRREEIAQLSGISATWYTWIEQGRDVSVSPAALARLADALQLSVAERGYLFELAEKRDPHLPAETAAQVPEGLDRAVQAVTTPAYVLDRVWTACAWNAAAARLFIGWLDHRDDARADRNLLRYIFLNPVAKKLITPWDERASRVISEFRADVGREIDTPAVETLITDLRKRSVLFDQGWRRQAVLTREGVARSFRHPDDGLRAYDQHSFAFAPRPEFKLVILTPAP